MPPPKKRLKANPTPTSTILQFFQGHTTSPNETHAFPTKQYKAKRSNDSLGARNPDVIIISDDEDEARPFVKHTTDRSLRWPGPEDAESSAGAVQRTNVLPIICKATICGPTSSRGVPETTDEENHGLAMHLPSTRFVDFQGAVCEDDVNEETSSVSGCTPPPPNKLGAVACSNVDLLDPKADISFGIASSSDITSIDVDSGEADVDWLNDDDEFVNDDPDVDFDDADVISDDEVSVITPNMGKGQCLGNVLMEDVNQSGTCPVCNTSLADQDAESVANHVNACLDNKPYLQAAGRSSNGPLLPSNIPSKRERIDAKPLKPPNAFSLLMSSRKENDAWKVAEVDLAKPDSAAGRARRAEGRRKAPFYKVMQGMPIAVDAFRYGRIPGVKAYFLTHAHSDHYTNLSSNWKNGPIYCSKTTANLIKLMLKVDPKWVHPLAEDMPFVIPDTGGVEVTVLEANHCPGSSLFLFKGLQTADAGDSDFTSPFVGTKRQFRYLHCGDFRASPRHALHPAIKDQKLDTVYLDTTYLNAKYCFPPQRQVMEACAALAKQLVHKDGRMNNDTATSQPSVGNWLSSTSTLDMNIEQRGSKGFAQTSVEDDCSIPLKEESAFENEDEPQMHLPDDKNREVHRDGTSKRVLVIIGTYSIGKERIVKEVARSLHSKVFCDSRKRAILLCQDDPELHGMLTDDPYDAQVHLVPLQTVNHEKLEPYYSKYRSHFGSVVGFRPTGWTYSPPAGTDLLPKIPNVISRSQSRKFTPSSLNLMRNSTDQFKLYGVPYSEHSSFFELTCFALSIDAVKFIATVNVGSAKSRGMMSKWFEKWDAERKKRLKDGKEKVVPYRHLDYW